MLFCEYLFIILNVRAFILHWNEMEMMNYSIYKCEARVGCEAIREMTKTKPSANMCVCVCGYVFDGHAVRAISFLWISPSSRPKISHTATIKGIHGSININKAVVEFMYFIHLPKYFCLFCK